MRTSATDWALLLLRVGFAALMLLLHGGPRAVRAFEHIFSGQPWGFVGVVERLGFPYPLVFALLSTAAESLGVLSVGLGIWTRLAAAVVAMNLVVAVWNEGIGGDSFELPAVYLVMACSLVLAGGGRLTLPRLLGR